MWINIILAWSANYLIVYTAVANKCDAYHGVTFAMTETTAYVPVVF